MSLWHYNGQNTEDNQGGNVKVTATDETVTVPKKTKSEKKDKE